VSNDIFTWPSLKIHNVSGKYYHSYKNKHAKKACENLTTFFPAVTPISSSHNSPGSSSLDSFYTVIPAKKGQRGLGIKLARPGINRKLPKMSGEGSFQVKTIFYLKKKLQISLSIFPNHVLINQLTLIRRSVTVSCRTRLSSTTRRTSTHPPRICASCAGVSALRRTAIC